MSGTNYDYENNNANTVERYTLVERSRNGILGVELDWLLARRQCSRFQGKTSGEEHPSFLNREPFEVMA